MEASTSSIMGSSVFKTGKSEWDEKALSERRGFETGLSAETVKVARFYKMLKLAYRGQHIRNETGRNLGLWNVDLLLATDPKLGPLPLTLKYGEITKTITPKLLRTKTDPFSDHLEKNFRTVLWTYPLGINQGEVARKVTYSIKGEDFHFIVPGVDERVNSLYYSCNGRQPAEPVKGKIEEEENISVKDTWVNINDRHAEQAFHVSLGGGDQVYCDGVLRLPIIMDWHKIKDVEKRKAMPFTKEMADQVFKYYLERYLQQFSYEGYREHLTMVPGVMNWDDHDIFDDWGSLPPYLHDSHVYQGIFNIAMQFYLRFQLHTTKSTASRSGFFGKNSFHAIRMAGKTAFLAVDTRSERSETQVVSPTSWDMIFKQLSGLPTHCKHAVVMLSIPILYPELKYVEKALTALGGETFKNETLNKLLGKVADIFEMREVSGVINLSGDVRDEWLSTKRLGERKMLIERLQKFAQEKSIRISFVSGDVHLATYGQAQTADQEIPKEYDFRSMGNLVSSSSVNEPAPGILGALIAAKGAWPEKFNTKTRIRLMPMKKEATKREREGLSSVVICSRNFGQITELVDDRLKMGLHVEGEGNSCFAPVKPESYYRIVPSLKPVPAGGLPKEEEDFLRDRVKDAAEQSILSYCTIL